MAKDPKTRIQYTAKASRISNAWKRWQGENHGIKRINGIAQKQAFEREFQEWANSYNNGEHKDLLAQLQMAYEELEPFLIQNIIFNERVLAPEIVAFAHQFDQLVKLSEDGATTTAMFNEELNRVRALVRPFFRDFNVDIDREIFRALSNITDGVDMYFTDALHKFSDNCVNKLYAQSVFTNEARLNSVLRRANRRNIAKSLGNDPLLNYAREVFTMHRSVILPELEALNANIAMLQRTYMRAQMEMQPDRVFYPDANSTLRVSYGRVEGFSPADAVTYRYYTTLSGLMAKENPDIFEFTVKPRLKELYNNRDFGRYANSKGEMPIAFIASNHTVGGNSGSPVLNGRGEIIGVNFDRIWQGTMSGLMWDPTQCRNISVDTRFILFIIDKFAEAGYLFDEMTIVE